MFNLNHYQPTRVVFGDKALNEIAKIIQTYGNNVFIVCSKSFPGRSESGLLFSLLEKSGIHYELFDEVTTNPTEGVVQLGATYMKDKKSNVILSVGGGSAHDAAKAIKLRTAHTSGNLIDYTVAGKYSVPGIANNMIPHITVPTISGTGAEVSPASLVRIENRKNIIYSPFLYPIACVVDTELFTCQDRGVLSQVGVDAFYQGVECFLASNANPFSDMFALSAIIDCMKYLPSLLQNPNNDTFKQLVELSSINSIKGVSNAGVGAIHALSDPLSGQFNVHHGVAETIVARNVIMHYIEKNYKRVNLLEKHIYQAFGHILNDFPSSFVQQFDWFLSELEIDVANDIKTIRTRGYDIDSLVSESNNPDMSTAPVQLSKLEIASIFQQSL